MNRLTRRDLLGAAAASAAASLLPVGAVAQERRFAPEPGAWRSFELTTRVELAKPAGAARVWLPMPSVDSDYQQSLDNVWSGNAAHHTRGVRQPLRREDAATPSSPKARSARRCS